MFSRHTRNVPWPNLRQNETEEYGNIWTLLQTVDFFFFFLIFCWRINFHKLPWRMCLGHPHKVHVTGQQGEVRHRLGVVGAAEVTIGQQNINDQLQVGLPSNWLPEQNYSCTQDSEIIVKSRCGRPQGGRSSEVFLPSTFGRFLTRLDWKKRRDTEHVPLRMTGEQFLCV